MEALVTNPTEPATSGKVTRRQLAAGVAWATPVIALAGTAPAYAASPDQFCNCLTIDHGGEFYMDGQVIDGLVTLDPAAATFTLNPTKCGDPSVYTITGTAGTVGWSDGTTSKLVEKGKWNWDGITWQTTDLTLYFILPDERVPNPATERLPEKFCFDMTLAFEKATCRYEACFAIGDVKATGAGATGDGPIDFRGTLTKGSLTGLSLP